MEIIKTLLELRLYSKSLSDVSHLLVLASGLGFQNWVWRNHINIFSIYHPNELHTPYREPDHQPFSNARNRYLQTRKLIWESNRIWLYHYTSHIKPWPKLKVGSTTTCRRFPAAFTCDSFCVGAEEGDTPPLRLRAQMQPPRGTVWYCLLRNFLSLFISQRDLKRWWVRMETKV